jgi:uridine kinase
VPSTGCTPQTLAAALLSRPAHAGGTRVLAVDGPSGSGKTTLAGHVSGALGGAPVVHMDDLYPGWDGLDDAVPRLLEWLLEPLSRAEPARYRRYDWAAGAYAEWREVPPCGALVVEGVGSGALPCAPYLSVLVWVDAPRHVRFARGIERDGEAYLPYWQRWAAQEERHFALHGTRERADVMCYNGARRRPARRTS